MRAGEFADGAHVLRAKIDMASPNINMRDPVLYRIRRAHHHRTGDAWCIYPMYDFAHPPSDAIEKITHSLCTLEFEDHRPLYDWLIDNLPVPAQPRQIEFARLNLSYTVMSKRKLLTLVEEGHVSGWDDPRMPTHRRHAAPRLSARGDPHVLRAHRRGQAREPGRRGAARARRPRGSQQARAARDGRAASAPRGDRELSGGADRGVRDRQQPRGSLGGHAAAVPFSRVLYIERDDFMETPPKKFFRLAPGREVRLRGAYFITCSEVVKDAAGEIVELRCTYDPATRGGDAADGRKVKATLHWVSAAHAVDAEVRLYDRLFKSEIPGDAGDYRADLNPASLEVVAACKIEPSAAAAPPARATSSSGSATSASIPTRARGCRCSTAPSPSRTAGPGWRPPKRVVKRQARSDRPTHLIEE